MPIPLPVHCKSCILYPEHRQGLGFSHLEGSGTNGVLVIAEALGEWEEIDGLPLRPQAPAGSVFQKSLRWQGLDRSEFSLTNIVRCLGGNTQVYLADGGSASLVDLVAQEYRGKIV